MRAKHLCVIVRDSDEALAKMGLEESNGNVKKQSMGVFTSTIV